MITLILWYRERSFISFSEKYNWRMGWTRLLSRSIIVKWHNILIGSKNGHCINWDPLQTIITHFVLNLWTFIVAVEFGMKLHWQSLAPLITACLVQWRCWLSFPAKFCTHNAAWGSFWRICSVSFQISQSNSGINCCEVIQGRTVSIVCKYTRNV